MRFTCLSNLSCACSGALDVCFLNAVAQLFVLARAFFSTGIFTLLPRSASGWHLDDLITPGGPMRLYSVYDPTEKLTLPESGPPTSSVSYMLHLNVYGP
jgi:hypothetical protein